MPVRFKKRRIVLAAHDFCQIISPGQRVDTGLKRYEDINREFLWRQAIMEKSWSARNAADWNERAAAFARRTGQSPYIESFLTLLNAEPSWSVLDVGSGPGILALPLSNPVKTVTCIDFSSATLQILAERVKQSLYSHLGLHQLASRMPVDVDLNEAYRRSGHRRNACKEKRIPYNTTLFRIRLAGLRTNNPPPSTFCRSWRP